MILHCVEVVFIVVSARQSLCLMISQTALQLLGDLVCNQLLTLWVSVLVVVKSPNRPSTNRVLRSHGIPDHGRISHMPGLGPPCTVRTHAADRWSCLWGYAVPAG